MYPHFIEVHQICQDEEWLTLINIDQIVYIEDNGIMTSRSLAAGKGNSDYVPCRESYEELKALIRDAGCQIQKADPRLDTTHPLTMEDIRGMIGEPVWNSNSLKWYLVRCESQNEVSFTDSIGYGYEADAKTLIKYPLYRMKQD